MAIVIETPLDDRVGAIAIGSRCLLGVLLHELFRSLSCCTHAALLLQRLCWLLLRVVVNFLSGALGAVWWWEASADCLDHLREPEQVEQIESDVGSQVRSAEPQREVTNFHEGGGLAQRVVEITVVRELSKLVHEVLGCGVSLRDCTVDVIEDQVAAVVAPDNATAEEGCGQECAVDSLVDGTSEVELVAEPVDVQEWARKLVQKEDRCVVVEEWAL